MMSRSDLVRMAHTILDMDDELEILGREILRLSVVEKKYNDLLNSSIAHGQKMMVNLLDVAMTPGVLEAMDKANKSTAGKCIACGEFHGEGIACPKMQPGDG